MRNLILVLGLLLVACAPNEEWEFEQKYISFPENKLTQPWDDFRPAIYWNEAVGGFEIVPLFPSLEKCVEWMRREKAQPYGKFWNYRCRRVMTDG